MIDLLLPDRLVEDIRLSAEAEGIPVADWLENAIRHYRRITQRLAISAEAEAWRTAPPEVREQYRGEYVAVIKGEVVDHDIDRVALYQRVDAKYDNTPVLITPAEGRLPMRVVSTRLERLQREVSA